MRRKSCLYNEWYDSIVDLIVHTFSTIAYQHQLFANALVDNLGLETL
jgi:hypothetical protein